MKFKHTTIQAGLFLLFACGIQYATAQNQAAEAPNHPEYRIVHLHGDAYLAHSDSHNTVFLVTSEGTILADPLSAEFSEWLKSELATHFDSTVRYVLYSHHHWDHASGGAVFADTAELIGHENMIPGLALPLPENYAGADKDRDGRISKDEAGGGIRKYFDSKDLDGDGYITGEEININVLAPKTTYSDTYEVSLGGKTALMVFSGNNHTDDGSIIYFSEDGVGLGVDWLNIGTFPKNLYGTGIDHWIESVDRMLALEPSHVVPGHGDVGTYDDLAAYGQYFKDLKAATNAAISQGITMEEFQQNISLEAYSAWTGYDRQMRGNAGEAYRLATP